MTMVGTLIQIYRKDRKMTQSDLASASGLTQTTISKLEQGLCSPNVGTLIKIADALDLNADALVMKQLAETEGSPEQGHDATKGEEILFEIGYKKISNSYYEFKYGEFETVIMFMNRGVQKYSIDTVKKKVDECVIGMKELRAIVLICREKGWL